MNRATSRISTHTLSHASHALAEFFDGIVLVEEEDGTLQPASRSPEMTPPPSDQMEANEFDLTELAELTELTEPELSIELSAPPSLPSKTLDRQPPPESQVLVSLAQLRQWYAAARARGESDRLARIQALGVLFKQTFGAAEPEVPKPFLGWTAEEIQWWLEDLNGGSADPESIQAIPSSFPAPVHSAG